VVIVLYKIAGSPRRTNWAARETEKRKKGNKRK
jgi:hypothetical protein